MSIYGLRRFSRVYHVSMMRVAHEKTLEQLSWQDLKGPQKGQDHYCKSGNTYHDGQYLADIEVLKFSCDFRPCPGIGILAVPIHAGTKLCDNSDK